MTTTETEYPLRRWWSWGVAEREHPRGVSDRMRALLRGRPPASDGEAAMLDGYRARSAACPPVPQRREYRSPEDQTED